MAQFPGPLVLVPNGYSDAAKLLAARLCARYSDAPNNAQATVICRHNNKDTSFLTTAAEEKELSVIII
jgi:hypothetical protein